MQETLVNFKQVYFKQSLSLMNRFDFKFILNSEEASYLLNILCNEYDVISNNEQLVRGYETKYFDTKQRDSFYLHHKGKLPRHKIRTRTYLDTNDQFVEIKYKNNKDKTEKFRINVFHSNDLLIQSNVVTFLNEHNINHLDALEEALLVKYNRISLIHKNLNERVTFDFDITFANDQKKTLAGDLIIVEVKQETKIKSPVILLLKSMNKRTVSISKYCYGLLSIDDSIKRNNFNSLIKNLHKINTPV
jgi:hypothetical protein